jgi:replicative DNA helicase
MLSQQAWHEVADRLNEDDFYRDDHRLLFRAIVGVVRQRCCASICIVAHA